MDKKLYVPQENLAHIILAVDKIDEFQQRMSVLVEGVRLGQGYGR